MRDQDCWQSLKLDDLGFVGRGRSRHRPRNDPSLYGGPYPFVQTGDVKSANFRLREFSQTYNEKGLQQSKLWDPGTLCITIAANIAETAILDIEACFPDSVVGFVPNPDRADARFIKYYIDTIKLNMQSVSKGTTQDNLSLDKLLQFDFRVPPLPTQRKIADILSAYDDLIENNTRRIAILEEMAQRLYQEWFVHFRYPGHENVPLVDSELGPIPEGWEVKRLGEIAEEVRCSVQPADLESETPYVGLEHFPRKSITLREWGSIESVTSTKLRFSRGDILFGKIRPYFHKVVVAPFDGATSSDTIVIRPKSDEMFGLVLGCVSSDQFVEHATLTSQGTKMPRANWNVLANYCAVRPTCQIAQCHYEFIDSIVEALRTLVFQNKALERSRELLLPRLLGAD